jgi:hypothetical protein
LKTITVVDTGERKTTFGKSREKTSRNCSSRTPTCLISFSLAFPISRKLFERTLLQVSFEKTGTTGFSKARARRIARTIVKRVRCCLNEVDPGFAMSLTDHPFSSHPSGRARVFETPLLLSKESGLPPVGIFLV